MTSTRANDLRSRFLRFHTTPPGAPTPGILVMPNPWDIGSAKLLAHAGAVALATTSSGHAGSQGRLDQNAQRDELIAHVVEMAASVDVPFSVDSEDCFGVDADAAAELLGPGTSTYTSSLLDGAIRDAAFG